FASRGSWSASRAARARQTNRLTRRWTDLIRSIGRRLNPLLQTGASHTARTSVPSGGTAPMRRIKILIALDFRGAIAGDEQGARGSRAKLQQMVTECKKP